MSLDYLRDAGIGFGSRRREWVRADADTAQRNAMLVFCLHTDSCMYFTSGKKQIWITDRVRAYVTKISG